MNILILNSGSSSLKFQWLLMPQETCLFRGMVEGIGKAEGAVISEAGEKKSTRTLAIADHAHALKIVFELLREAGLEQDRIQAVGHRVVHGGEKYTVATLITPEVLEDINALCELAPLHNPANIAGIRATQTSLPGIPNVAVFDTAFHQTLPPKAYLYGLPYELYEKYRIRKYGFHGISHKYISTEAVRILKENIKDFRIISCHLGSGASVCAIAKGKSMEISMGFTPLEGLMMGTRAGSFDPEIILYLLRKGYTIDGIEEIMQKKSGLRGISKSSFDVRDLREEELSGIAQSELAFEMFVYRVQRFIGSYTAALGGIDLLLFTGGVGEKAYFLRRRICEHLGHLGIALDMKKNRANETIISSASASVTTMVIPTNEELQIARESYSLLKKSHALPEKN